MFPEVPGRGAEGVRELLWAPRGASRIHLRPSGHHFSTLVGSPGTRLGFSGTMDLRKLDWRFKRQLGFHFLKLPLACYGDLRLKNPLPARGAESVVV